MRRAWSAVVLSLGLFALVTQTLLFRSFLTAFEGSELGIGSFFGSWLLWVAAGAWLGRIVARRAGLRPAHFVALTLLYLPAFVAQDLLVANARDLAGVVAYEVFPLPRMVAVSLLANAPLSLLTGFLFTLACRCTVQAHALPVARVYVLESLGSFFGGVATTLLLAAGVGPGTIVFGAALALALSVFAFLRRRAWMPAAALLAMLALGIDKDWTEISNRARWDRLLDAGDYRGSFTTAQGEYLFGERQGQFLVMAWGGVVEALPGAEHASEVLAGSLVHAPEARRVLVFGPGSLPLCRRFLALPQIESVAWLHPDPDYPRALSAVLPDEFRDDRLSVPARDVRALLEDGGERYDLVLLNLPDVTTLVLNRYVTREFFDLLRRALAPGGVVGLRISGGENYLGSELAYLGASALTTLEEAFAHIALKPGEESWLFASNAGPLTSSPAALRDRFASIEGAAALFPPEGLLTLYPPDRIKLQLGAYRWTSGEAGEEVLSNRDNEPKALLYSLAVALRRAGRRAVSDDLDVALHAGAGTAAAAIALYVLLRLGYLLLGPRGVAGGAPALFDGGFLVLSTGLAGMSASIVLMFLYQVRFGTLFLHAGLVFSLFMLGLFAGARCVEAILSRRGREPRALLPVLLLAHVILLGAVGFLPADLPRSAFALLFVLCGAFTGAYFPVAAQRYRAAGREAASSGSALESLDHFGGALGALLTGLFLLPLLGTATTAGLLAALVAANLAVLVRPARIAPEPMPLRRLGYASFGVAVFLLAASNLASAAGTRKEERRLIAAVYELSPDAEWTQRTAPLLYFELAEERGYVFGTDALAAGIYGYAGPIRLAVHVDKGGVLRGLRVVSSRETPAYLERLRGWQADLTGRNLFAPDPFEGVDTVTGATMSSGAILRTLETSGRRFAAEVLGREVAGPPVERGREAPDRNFWILALLTAGAIALRARPNVWTRRLFLAVVLASFGLWLNLQFSTQQIFNLVSLEFAGLRWTGAYFLLLGIPLVVLLVGNVYCGYLCPFGALQELLGDFRPKAAVTDPRPGLWRYGRAVKYGLLALLMALFALTRDTTVLSADPLITFFGSLGGSRVFWMACAAVALSLVFRRFWCRNLCPAGAFLALLNRVQLLRRILPRTHPGRCDLGVRSHRELDCLCCDRCRHEAE